MNLKLRNTWEYKGDDWWAWKAYIDDLGSGDLAKVDSVEYVLHPTFKNPIRAVKDREGGFQMKTEGWGSFRLKAFVHLKDGQKLRLDHYIELSEIPAKGTSK